MVIYKYCSLARDIRFAADKLKCIYNTLGAKVNAIELPKTQIRYEMKYFVNTWHICMIIMKPCSIMIYRVR